MLTQHRPLHCEAQLSKNRSTRLSESGLTDIGDHATDSPWQRIVLFFLARFVTCVSLQSPRRLTATQNKADRLQFCNLSSPVAADNSFRANLNETRPLDSPSSIYERLRTAIQVIVLAGSKTRSPSDPQLHSPQQPNVSIGSNSECGIHRNQRPTSSKAFDHNF